MTALATLTELGLDENGLGSRLGPMTVTGVRLRVDARLVADRARYLAVCARAGIDDSKAVAAHGAMARTEARVLALLRVHLGLEPASLDAWMREVSLDDEAALRAPCPTQGAARSVCFSEGPRLPAFGGVPSHNELAAAEALRAAGVTLEAVRVGLACAGVLNDAKGRGASRFDVDLGLMVRAIAALTPPREASRPRALCGKVGARKSYAAALAPLAPLTSVLEETRERSSYAVPGFGEVHFVLDGDATEPPIALASLFGKYARELWMLRHNRYWLEAVPDAPSASGYHDPVTARLVAATALVRAERGVSERCFQR